MKRPFPCPRAKGCVLWCTWFALVMGAPYAPLSSKDFDLAYGPSSLSNLFAWAALGVLAGLWLGTHPTVMNGLSTRLGLRRFLAASGAVLSLAVVACSWTMSCSLLIDPLFGAAGTEGAAIGFGIVERFVLSRGVVLLVAGSFLCALCAPFLYGHAPEGITGSVHTPVFLVAAPLAVGFLQPLAWTTALPHSPFPQPPLFESPVVVGDLWTAGSFPGILFMALPTALTMLFASVCTGSFLAANRRVATDPKVVFSSLCLGILGFRVALRLVPKLCEVSLTLAIGALVLYLMCYVSSIVAMLSFRQPVKRHERGERVSESARAQEVSGPPDGLGVEELRRALTPRGRSHLTERGLTTKELLVFCAHLKGLSAAQTGDALGIEASTVRAYRRRARLKLGVDTLDAAVVGLPEGAVSSEGESPDEGGDAKTRAACYAPALISTSCFMTLPILAFFPAEEGVWSDIWTTAFGIGAGLLVSWVIVGTGSLRYDSPRTGRAAGACLVLGSVLAFIALIMLRRGSVFPLSDCAARNVASFSAAALLVGCSLPLGLALASELFGDRKRNVLAHLMLIPCCALLSIGLGSDAHAAVSAASCLGCLAALFLREIGVVPHGRRFRVLDKDCLAGMPGLVMAAFCAWCWEESLRSGMHYDSLLPVLGTVAAALLLVTVTHALFNRSITKVEALAVAATVLVALLSVGGSQVPAVCVLLVLCLVVAESASRDGNSVYGETPVRSWHSPLVTAAAGIVCGTVFTNAYGEIVLELSGQSPEKAVNAQILVQVLLATIAALAMAACVVAMLGDRNPPKRDKADVRRLEGFLTYRGLSRLQTAVVCRLYEGSTIRSVANELGYSESTVRLARRDAYRMLGVATRGQLVGMLDGCLGM